MVILQKIVKRSTSNKKQKKVIRLLLSSFMVVMVFSYASCNAQSNLRLSVGTQLHFSEIELKSSEFESSNRGGAGILVGISKGLDETWSLHSGVGLNYYRNRHAIKNYSGTQETTDMSGEAFEFRYTSNKFSEKQKLTAMTIPLAVQYESFGTVRLYSKLGVEANLFIAEESDSKTANLKTAGFFPRINAVLNGPKFAGFGNYSKKEFNEDDLNVKNSYNAVIELGVKQIYPSGSAFYAGGFFKYGINNISSKGGSSGLVSFDTDSPTNFRSSSVLNALENPQDGAKRISNEANFHVFGIVLRYEFDLQFSKPNVDEADAES